jgi:hypothetical protein
VLRCLLPAPAPPPAAGAAAAGSWAEALAGLYGGTGFAPVSIRNNPAMPCDCEAALAACEDADAGYELQVEPPAAAFDAPDVQRAHWASPAAARAAAHALNALRSPPRYARSTADEALQMCPHCGDAWTARALKSATNLEEALQMFRTAVTEATAALAPELLAELSEQRGLTCAQLEQRNCRTLWLVHPVRPLVRAMIGVASTLRKLRRWGEAADAYMALQALDPGSHNSSSFWINWKAHVPETLLAAGRVEAARAYMCHPDNADGFTWMSSGIHWLAAAAVLDGMAMRDASACARPWPGAAFAKRVYDGTCPDSMKLAAAAVAGRGAAFVPGAALVSFCAHYGTATAWLLQLPEAPPPPAARGVMCSLHGDGRQPANRAVWAQGSRAALEAAAPAALAVMRRALRTLALHGWISGEPLLPLDHGPGAIDMPAPDAATVLRWLADGDVFVHARFGHYTLLSHAARFPSAAGAELTRALVAAGACPCDGAEQHGQAPLQQWAYDAGSLAAGKHMLAARTCTADAVGHANHLMAAACLAANQCNAAQAALLLPAALPALRAVGCDMCEVQEGVLEDVLCSTVPACLESRGAAPCQRCAANGKPHAPGASLVRTLGTLVGAGLLQRTDMAAARRAASEEGGVTARLLRRWEATNGAALWRRDAGACAACGEAGGKRCGRCKTARFCGEECMHAGWPAHKAACKAAAAGQK